MNKKTRIEQRAAHLRTRSALRRYRRRCTRCGGIGYYRKGEKTCYQLIGMLGSYRCGGPLEQVPRKPKKTLQEGIKAMLAEPDGPGASRLGDLRLKAERNMIRAVKRRDDAQARFNQFVGNLRRYGSAKWALRCAKAATEANQWAAKVVYYEKRTLMTDVELAAEVVCMQRISRRTRPARRAMTLEAAI